MENRPGKTTELDPKELERLLAEKDDHDDIRTYGSTSNLMRYDDSCAEITNTLRHFSIQKRTEWFQNFVEYAITRNNFQFILKAKRIHEELVRMQIPVEMKAHMKTRWQNILREDEDNGNDALYTGVF